MSDAPMERPNTAQPRGGWMAMIVIGGIVTALAGPQLFGATLVATAVAFGGGEGFVEAPAVRVQTSSSAIVSPPIDWQRPLGDVVIPDIRVAVTAGHEGDAPIFIGIAPSESVASYLEGVAFAELQGLRGTPPRVQVREIVGASAAEPPALQTFWAASASGPGAQTVAWALEPGDWTLVIMNADASPAIESTLRLGVEAPWAGPLVAILAIVALVSLLLGLALLVSGLLGWGRRRGRETAPMTGPYPVAVTGQLDSAVSRWLWLVKWVLVIPHYVVLSVLWVGFVVATVLAFFGILFTGQYPRSLFPYTAGVLRYTWRVAFYAYSALGTDRYPPFSLTSSDYPADFQVAYPERLNNGLVLVKGWLLALPHLVVVGIVVGGSPWVTSLNVRYGTPSGVGISLLGVLVLVAAVILLFSGRHRQPLFDLIVGLNRWALRVAAYVALMRDEYPPFRLDQGPVEPIVSEITEHSAPAEI